MKNIFNMRVLLLIPILFLIIASLRIVYDYNNLVNNERSFAKKEAEVLNSLAMSNRNYYQKLFINKTIPLNKDTLKALPAYSSILISKKFSKDNLLNITIRAVSNRARNHLNATDIDELKAIDFFSKNRDKKYYFSYDNKEYYQYASALRIDNKCLLCHGSKEKAPKFIRESYSEAYNYKLGDVRGIMSIRIPSKSVRNYFIKNFISSIVYDILLFIVLFLGISYLFRKSKKINSMLTREVKEKTSELKATYVVDKLTNLPNRNQLIEDINNESQETYRYLALLNIDSFKDINDFYGHKAGDKILKDFTLFFVNKCPYGYSKIYKLPSDEFAIFLNTKKERVEFVPNVSNIISLIDKYKFIFENNEIFITVSCGISFNRPDLLTTADIALKKAKKDNKSVVVYDETMDISKKIIKNTENIELLRDAIKNDNIRAFYQPIYNVLEERIEKYECLVRIVQDDGTIVLPYRFLDVAIKSKQYFHITKIMITKSFEFFKDKDFEFSINLSILDMTNGDMIKFITTSLQNFSDPKRVVFEILENVELRNYEEIKSFIKVIKRFGCKFAIDDFGSGYSNFSHVYELNVDYLKIDSSLVKHIATNENSRIITKTIISFASSLGLKTIAEYVEDKESLDILEEMGVDYIQGYYIGKPSPGLISCAKKQAN